MSKNNDLPAHFQGKDAIEHVVEAQAKGIVAACEIHGMEIPGHLSAATDAARETAVVLPLLYLFLNFFQISHEVILAFAIFGAGWLIWKAGRSAWLGWARLERLHRVLEQEKWEIDHNRAQERSELTALYRAKGFEGKLLEDVIDVLMADGDRLLRVMVEEELGLTLQSHEHPLKQAIGAAFGVISAWILCTIGLILWPVYGILAGSLITIGGSSAFAAKLTQNRMVNAIVWNISLGVLSVGTTYFLFDYFKTGR